MSQPRKHHFIPVFYLKQWANTDGELIEYRRRYNDKIVARLVGPRGTGFQRHLYSFSDCPPKIAQHLEKVFLQRTDNLASRAMAQLLDGNTAPWTTELRSAWSRFVFNFLIRHPDPYAEVKAVSRHGWKPNAQDYQQLRKPDDPATIEEWIQLQGDNWADIITMRLIQAAMDNEVVGERLNRMNWRVRDLSASEFLLLTSDWPLIRHIDGERILFVLPMSPTVLFMATTHRDFLENLRRMSPNSLVRHINKDVVSGARLYVYSADRTQKDFIEEYMSQEKQEPPIFPSLARAFAN